MGLGKKKAIGENFEVQWLSNKFVKKIPIFYICLPFICIIYRFLLTNLHPVASATSFLCFDGGGNEA